MNNRFETQASEIEELVTERTTLKYNHPYNRRHRPRPDNSPVGAGNRRINPKDTLNAPSERSRASVGRSVFENGKDERSRRGELENRVQQYITFLYEDTGNSANELEKQHGCRSVALTNAWHSTNDTSPAPFMMKILKRLCYWVWLIALSLIFHSSYAETVVSGEVAGEWTLEGSPYIIDQHAMVPAGNSLLIEPGVVVLLGGYLDGLTRQSDSLVIEGTLIADGVADDSVSFLFDSDDEVPNIGVILITSGIMDSCVFSNCVIESKTLVSSRRITFNSVLFRNIDDFAFGTVELQFIGVNNGELRAGGVLTNSLFQGCHIRIANADPLIDNCHFRYSSIRNYINSDATISNCVSSYIIYYIEGSSGALLNSEFSYISIGSRAGFPSTEPLIEGCFLGTVSITGERSFPIVRKCLIKSNDDGVYVSDAARPVLINNTIEANTALHINDINARPPTGMTFKNNLIVYSNNGYKAEFIITIQGNLE